MDANSLISLDGWRIDASSYRITRAGVEKKLEPRSLELLLYYAGYPDKVIPREEIEGTVWQGRVVGYDALSGTIARIRKAFGDTSKNPRVIETVPKAGGCPPERGTSCYEPGVGVGVLLRLIKRGLSLMFSIVPSQFLSGSKFLNHRRHHS